MRRLGAGLMATAMACWIGAIAGCGRLPVAPDAGLDASSGTMAAGPGGDQARPSDPIKATPTLTGVAGLQIVQPIAGPLGAEVQVGRVTVDVPGGAISGTAQITVTVPDTTKLECFLNITPEAKNHFSVPVNLTFALPPSADPRLMSVFWYDEVHEAWVPITSTYDAGTGRMMASLQHFSIYKADTEVEGRAGW